MPRKTPPAIRKKPPAPSVPKPTEKLDPNRWKAATLALAGKTIIRHKRLMQLHIAGATPEKAAEEARTYYANSRVTWERKGKPR